MYTDIVNSAYEPFDYYDNYCDEESHNDKVEAKFVAYLMSCHWAHSAVSLCEIGLNLSVKVTHIFNNLSLAVESLVRLLHQADSF